jgi:hypothetical protein
VQRHGTATESSSSFLERSRWPAPGRCKQRPSRLPRGILAAFNNENVLPLIPSLPSVQNSFAYRCLRTRFTVRRSVAVNSSLVLWPESYLIPFSSRKSCWTVGFGAHEELARGANPIPLPSFPSLPSVQILSYPSVTSVCASFRTPKFETANVEL